MSPPSELSRFDRLVYLGYNFEGAWKASKEMVELEALSLASSYCNNFRFRIDEGRGKRKFPSTMILMDVTSGAGKNAPYKYMKDLLLGRAFFEVRNYLKRSLYLKEEALRVELESKFPLATLDKDEKKANEKAHRDALKDFRRRYKMPKLWFSKDGSYDGFALDRACLMDYSVGAPTVVNHEYGDVLSEMKSTSYLAALYNRATELVDDDFLGEKSTKVQRTPGSHGMGITLFYTMSDLKAEKRRMVLDKVLQAAGRRGFLLRETTESLAAGVRKKSEIPLVSDEDLESFSLEMRAACLELLEVAGSRNQLLVDIDDGDFEFADESYVPLSSAARAWYNKYSDVCADSVKDLWSSAPNADWVNIQNSLVSDMERKVLKVATILAVFNHGDTSLQVTVEDLEVAKCMVERFWANAKKFFDQPENPEVPELIGLFVKRGMSLTANEIRRSKIFKFFNSKTPQEEVHSVIYSNILGDLVDLGYNLEFTLDRNKYSYTLRRLSKAEKKLRDGDKVGWLKSLTSTKDAT